MAGHGWDISFLPGSFWRYLRCAQVHISAPKDTSYISFTPFLRRNSSTFRQHPSNATLMDGATSRTICFPLLASFQKSAVSSSYVRAPWEHSLTHAPQRIHLSGSMLYTVLPSSVWTAIFASGVGQARMQELQETHLLALNRIIAILPFVCYKKGAPAVECRERRVLFCVIYCAAFPDKIDLYLTWVFHLVLDAFCDIARKHFHAIV